MSSNPAYRVTIDGVLFKPPHGKRPTVGPKSSLAPVTLPGTKGRTSAIRAASFPTPSSTTTTAAAVLPVGRVPPKPASAPAMTTGTKRKVEGLFDDSDDLDYLFEEHTSATPSATTTSTLHEPSAKRARTPPPPKPLANRTSPIRDFEAHLRTVKPWKAPSKPKKGKETFLDKVRQAGPSPSYVYGIWRKESQDRPAPVEKKVKFNPAPSRFFDQFNKKA